MEDRHAFYGVQFHEAVASELAVSFAPVSAKSSASEKIIKKLQRMEAIE
jgi:hypothetical protein